MAYAPIEEVGVVFFSVDREGFSCYTVTATILCKKDEFETNLQASTPPSSWYLSPQVAELEKVAIFHNNWQVGLHALSTAISVVEGVKNVLLLHTCHGARECPDHLIGL